MNYFSTFGIFGAVLFAYCALTQGQTFAILDVMFKDGRRYVTNPVTGRFTNLIRAIDDTYKIEETVTCVMPEIYDDRVGTFLRAIFDIKGIYTMFGRVVVPRTHDDTYFPMELGSELEAQQLFNLAVRPKLYEKFFTYKLSAVYKYNEGRVLTDVDVSISGWLYSPAKVPNLANSESRFIIHSGEAVAAELRPHLLWTEFGFNYRAYDSNGIILTLSIPGVARYDYYLVKFVNKFDMVVWLVLYGKYKIDIIPEAPTVISDYFLSKNF